MIFEVLEVIIGYYAYDFTIYFMISQELLYVFLVCTRLFNFNFFRLFAQEEVGDCLQSPLYILCFLIIYAVP